MLEDLSAVTKTRARLGVLTDLCVSYIEKRPGRDPATSFTARATLPAPPTALGRALLAFSPPGTVEMPILQGLRAYTPNTITSPERFRRALAVTRLTRVAITREEFELGISAVATPVFGPTGYVVASLELAVRDLHQDLPVVMTALTVAARSLSRELDSRIPRTPPPHHQSLN